MSTTAERKTLADLDDTVRKVVADEADLIREQSHPEDSLSEIADTTVPADAETLYRIAANRPNTIGICEQEARAQGCMAGAESATDLIQCALYWYLYETAREEWGRLA